MRLTRQTMMCAILGLALVGAANAQRMGGGRGGGSGRGGGMRQGGGGFDQERMKEMMLSRLQSEIGATDEEWTALKPLVEDVMEKQMATRNRPQRPRRDGSEEDNSRSAARGRPPRPGQGDSEDDNSRSAEATALDEVLADDAATAADIKTKLTAFRAARTTQAEALQASREKLRAVLTTKQEAKLVVMGMLD